MAVEDKEVIGPKSPKQQMILATQADIAVVGGAAGSGKSFLALLSVLKYCQDPSYRGIIFRKTTNEITAQGGLWETALELYKKIYGKRLKSRTKPMKITFPNGASIAFSHMEHDKDRFSHQGAQYTHIIFDEGTHFSQVCVEYLDTRKRSATAKHKLQTLITCNPSPDSFLLNWVDWYLIKDGPDKGRPDKTKDGVLRYFVVQDGKYLWADDRSELEKIYGAGDDSGIKSFTFISATCEDNPVLLENQPGYISELKAKPVAEVQRLLYGNWYYRETTSGYFKREWVGDLVPLPPIKTLGRVRAWDLASSLPSDATPNPDYTAGVLISKDVYGEYYVEDVEWFRARPHGVLERILLTAEHDGRGTTIVIPADPGAAGRAYAQQIVRELSERGYYARIKTVSQSKVARFAPFAALAEAGGVRIVRGKWNSEYLSELERFDGSRNVHDDQVDATGDAFMELARRNILTQFTPPNLGNKANPFALNQLT